jgi:hypothetical protein
VSGISATAGDRSSLVSDAEPLNGLSLPHVISLRCWLPTPRRRRGSAGRSTR